nr:FAD-binding protein [Lachnospiraceae bacterium]
MEIKTDEAMSLHTTFRTGGPAKYFITVNDADELKKALSDAERPFIIGNGSNLLADDRGFDGTVIRLQGTFTEIKTEGNKISAGSGALLSTAAQAAAEASLTGMEFSYGIPGTVGGAVFMNAGAFGGEMRDVVEKVTLFDRETGEITDIPGEDMGFGYRKSILKGPDPLEF